MDNDESKHKRNWLVLPILIWIITIVVLITGTICFGIFLLQRQTACIISNITQNINESNCFYVNTSIDCTEYNGLYTPSCEIIKTNCTYLSVTINWYNCEQTDTFLFTNYQDYINKYNFYTTPNLQCSYQLEQCEDPFGDYTSDTIAYVIGMALFILLVLVMSIGGLCLLKKLIN